MTLSRRQAKAINQIIQEEVQGALEARGRRDGYLRRADIQERLLEAGPDAMRVDWDIVDSANEEIAQEVGQHLAMSMLYDFRVAYLRKIADVMNRHGMADMKIDPKSFPADLEEFDEDGIEIASMSAYNDVTAALTAFGKELGQMAVHMAGGTEPEEEE